jgi:hypothetical protein
LTDDFRTLMEQWLKQQQAYWAQLSAAAPSAQNVWGNLFNVTASAQAGPHSQPDTEPTQRILAQLASQILLLNQYAEPFFKALQPPASSADLTCVLELWLQTLQQQAGSDATERWKLPEALTALLQASGLDEAHLLDGTALETLSRLFGGPGMTPDNARAQAMDAMHLLTDYQQALQQYLGQIREVSQHAATRLLDALEHTDTPATSLGALHDLWVDHYELAYRQQAFSEAFQAAHGHISNAHMRLQLFAQRVRDTQLNAAGMATQHELQQLRRDAHLLRKQVRKLQQERAATPAVTPDHTAAMNSLRAELESLRNEIRQPPGEEPTGRKRKK